MQMLHLAFQVVLPLPGSTIHYPQLGHAEQLGNKFQPPQPGTFSQLHENKQLIETHMNSCASAFDLSKNTVYIYTYHHTLIYIIYAYTYYKCVFSVCIYIYLHYT